MSHQDGFPMASALVYVMHIGHDLRWIMTQGYQFSCFTKLLYYMHSQPWENINPMPKSTRDFDLWVIQRTCDHEIYDHSNSFSGIWHILLRVKSMSIDHIISGICNSRIWEVILIDDNTTLLDYEHQFMGSLHAVDSSSQTRALSVSL